MKRLWWFMPLALFAGLAALFAIGLGRDPSKLPSALIDQPVPAFALAPPETVTVPGLASADLGQGRPALVNFFASWCVPCRAEHPLLMALAAESDFAVLGINYKDKPADAATFLNRLGNPFARIGADQDGRTAIDFGVYGVPESFIISADGRIIHRHVGVLMPDDVRQTILPLLRQQATADSP